MAENKRNFLQLLVLLTKYKKLLLFIFIITATFSYLAVYFLIEEKFDATATVIPIEENTISPLAGFLKDLPIDITGSGFSNNEMNMYSTIVYSRGILENVIKKFDLIKVYELDTSDIDYREKALEELKDNIGAQETDNNAYEITVRANSPDLAAKITNYIIEQLNDRIIELKISKSKQNKEFLEARVDEIKDNLKKSEDSLMIFQKKSGLLSAEDQIKGMMDAYSTLETGLIEKEIEKSISQKTMSENDPRLKNIEIAEGEYQNILNNIKSSDRNNSPLLSLSSLPQKAVNYYRLLRTVEINNKLLEFVVPLYEQAKFEEQKDIPVLQVVDNAVPPAKKSFPPRLIITLSMSVGILFLVFIFILIKENESLHQSEEYKYISSNLLPWKKDHNK